jgi:hypothetical protein
METIISDISEIRSKEQSLRVVKVDHENWIVCYEDRDTAEKWIKEYPGSSRTGEAARLRQVDNF